MHKTWIGNFLEHAMDFLGTYLIEPFFIFFLSLLSLVFFAALIYGIYFGVRYLLSRRKRQLTGKV
jgi:hypothetical protein